MYSKISRARAHQSHLYFLSFILPFLLMVFFMSDFDALRIDHLKHFGFSLGLLWCTARLLKRVPFGLSLATLLAFALGLLKEFMDHQGQLGDVLANSGGIALALVILFALPALAWAHSPIRLRS